MAALGIELESAITANRRAASTERGLADLWGLARVYRIAPVSQEMVLNYVAQNVLGLPRSY